jgi:D-3-phosphoglycerate dehydrogenase
MLRSHALQEPEVDVTVRAIARCGAGTNNIPVPRMTELGIPVFNTPGANANAVKELIICGMLLASRRIVDGVNHMKALGEQGLAKERVEKDKALFGGREIAGKRLAIIGLGHIGSATARDAEILGMNVCGYDPGLSLKSALKLPRDMQLCDSIASAVASADYISINIPYIKGTPDKGGTHGIIGKDVIRHFKSDAVLLNFARGELVDSAAMKEFLDQGNGRYVSDFPDDVLWDHKNSVILPHLGASTEEAEDEAVRETQRCCNERHDAAHKKVSTLFAFHCIGGHGGRYHSRLFGAWNDSQLCQLSRHVSSRASRKFHSHHRREQERSRHVGADYRDFRQEQY